MNDECVKKIRVPLFISVYRNHSSARSVVFYIDRNLTTLILTIATAGAKYDIHHLILTSARCMSMLARCMSMLARVMSMLARVRRRDGHPKCYVSAVQDPVQSSSSIQLSSIFVYIILSTILSSFLTPQVQHAPIGYLIVCLRTFNTTLS